MSDTNGAPKAVKPRTRDLEGTVDAYIMRLVKDAAAKDVTFDQKTKVAQVLVGYYKIKKNLPDDSQGEAWNANEEGT